MKSLIMKKGSWHYLLASITMLGDLEYYDMDICRYTRRVLLGLLILGVAAMLLAFLGFMFWNVIFGVIFSLIYHQFLFTDLGILTSMIIVVVAVIINVKLFVDKVAAWELARDLRKMRKAKKPDGFVKVAYKSWKEKYCVRVEFSD